MRFHSAYSAQPSTNLLENSAIYFGSYTVYQENQYFVKNMLLLKNPQFSPNHYEIL